MKTQIFAAVPSGWLPENRNGVAASPTRMASRMADSTRERGGSADRSAQKPLRRAGRGRQRRRAIAHRRATGKRPCGRQTRTSAITRMLEIERQLRGEEADVVGDERHQQRADEAAADGAEAADDDDDEDQHHHLHAHAGRERLAVEAPT